MTTATETQTRPATLPERQARQSGYICLAGPYHPETEDWQLQRCLDDQRAADADVVLVAMRCRARVGNWIGLAIWRRAWK